MQRVLRVRGRRLLTLFTSGTWRLRQSVSFLYSLGHSDGRTKLWHFLFRWSWRFMYATNRPDAPFERAVTVRIHKSRRTQLGFVYLYSSQPLFFVGSWIINDRFSILIISNLEVLVQPAPSIKKHNLNMHGLGIFLFKRCPGFSNFFSTPCRSRSMGSRAFFSW